MNPARGSGIWKEGRELTAAIQDSITVSIRFVRYENDALVFSFDIQNQSARPLLVAPEQFSYKPVATTLPPGDTYMPYFPAAVKAVNPEQKMDRLLSAVAYNVR